MRTGNQVQTPGTPAQFSSPQMQNVDYLGLANQNYQNQLGAWNASQAGQENFISGLFGLGSAGLGAYGRGAFG